jgi:hypothetical protein
LAEGAPSSVSDAFVGMRLNGRIGATFGTASLDRATIEALLDRTLPA